MGIWDNLAKRRGYEKVNPTEKAADMSTGGSWGDIFGGYAGGSPSFTSFNNQKEQLGAYVDWVYAATRYIAETCATIDLRVFKNHTAQTKATLGQKRIYQPLLLDKQLKKMGTKSYMEKGADGKLVYRKDVAPLEELESHPVIDLLDAPNPYMTRTEFFEMTFLHLELAGEAFWAVNRNTKNGPPTELWPLMPNLVSVVADKEKFILGYLYTVGGEQLPFAPEDIIHHKYSNPNDLRRGMSAVQAAARIIDTDSHMADHNRRIFYNGATVDAVLYTDQKLNDENWKRLESQWKDQYSGTSNAHKTAILENGLKYAPMALNNRDLDFLAGMNFNRDMILAIFGVPKSLLGMDESMSRANAEAAEYAFSKNKIRPKMLRLTSRITEDLATQFGKNEDILVSFTDPVPDDKEFLLKEKGESLGGPNTIGWRTINDVRAEDGSDPIEGGDELWINDNMVPVGRAAKEPLPEDKPAVAEEDASAPDNDEDAEDTGDQDNEDGDDASDSEDTGSNSTAGDSGSTSSDSSTGDKSMKHAEDEHEIEPGCECCKGVGEHKTGFECYRCDASGQEKDALGDIPCDGREDSDNVWVDEDGNYRHAEERGVDTPSPKVLHNTESKVESDIKSTAKTKAELAQLQKDYVDIRNRVSDKYETDFLKTSHTRFEQQKKEVLGNLKTRFKGVSPVKSAVTKAKKKKTDNLFNKVASKAAWTAALLPIYKGAVVTTGNAAFNYVSDASTIGTSAQFSGADPDIQKFYDERSTLVSTGIDDTTDRMLKTSLIEGISNGESNAQLADRVETIYNAAAGFRAMRIARTESINATTFGTVEAWKQSGVVTGKQWQTNGPNPCPQCLDLDGNIYKLTENVFNKGDSFTVGEGDSAQTMNLDYQDVIGPPLHPNCACALIPILASQGFSFCNITFTIKV